MGKAAKAVIAVICVIVGFSVGSVILTAILKSAKEKPDVTYTAEDIVYATEKEQVFCDLGGFDYIKTNAGGAAVGYVCTEDRTGPVLVGKTERSVESYLIFRGDRRDSRCGGSFELNGETYYYSDLFNFQNGNLLDFKNKLGVYCSKAETVPDAAKEIAGLMDKTKIALTALSDAEGLKALANSDGAFELTGDIDLSSEGNWTPISGFTGDLLGSGHKIINLRISGNMENAGLFGVLEGFVADLVIEGADISLQGNAGKAGILAGTLQGTVRSVTVGGTLRASYYENVGGIAGYAATGSRAEKCTNLAAVRGDVNVGGVIGSVILPYDESKKEGTSTQMYFSDKNEGDVEGTECVGGVVGCVQAQSATVSRQYLFELYNFENAGKVEGESCVGGVIGAVKGHKGVRISLDTLKNGGEVIADDDFAGGILGYGEYVTEISAAENGADIAGRHYVGGWVGNSANTYLDCFGAENAAAVTGNGYVGGFAGLCGIVAGASNLGQIVSQGTILEAGGAVGSYVGGIAGYCNGAQDCENSADIDVREDGAYVGGIAGMIRATVQNPVEGNKNSGNILSTCEFTGGIAGKVTAVEPSDNLRGVFNVEENENVASVEGTHGVGGIFGSVEGTKRSGSIYTIDFSLSDLTNAGEITATGDYVGGIFGKGERVATIASSQNENNVAGANYVGGLVGYSPSVNIQAAGFTNAADISGKAYVGGIAGYAGVIEDAENSGVIFSSGTTVEDGNSCAYVGGIAGFCAGLIDCVNNSEIFVTEGRYAGGLVGYVFVAQEDVLRGNENNGAVEGQDFVGGIAGVVYANDSEGWDETRSLKITQNENRAEVTGENNVGGIAGGAYGLHSNYWNKYIYLEITYCKNMEQIVGNSYAGGIVGAYEYLKTDENILTTNETLYGELLGK